MGTDEASRTKKDNLLYVIITSTVRSNNNSFIWLFSYYLTLLERDCFFFYCVLSYFHSINMTKDDFYLQNPQFFDLEICGASNFKARWFLQSILKSYIASLNKWMSFFPVTSHELLSSLNQYFIGISHYSSPSPLSQPPLLCQSSWLHNGEWVILWVFLLIINRLLNV